MGHMQNHRKHIQIYLRFQRMPASCKTNIHAPLDHSGLLGFAIYFHEVFCWFSCSPLVWLCDVHFLEGTKHKRVRYPPFSPYGSQGTSIPSECFVGSDGDLFGWNTWIEWWIERKHKGNTRGKRSVFWGASKSFGLLGCFQFFEQIDKAYLFVGYDMIKSPNLESSRVQCAGHCMMYQAHDALRGSEWIQSCNMQLVWKLACFF